MKSLKTKALSYVGLLTFVISSIFALLPASNVSATHGDLIHLITPYSNCEVISGVVGNPTFPSYAPVDVAVYIRLADRNQPYLRDVVQASNPSPSHPNLPGSHGFTVEIPESYKDSLVETVYTVRAMEYTDSEEQLVTTASLGVCGSQTPPGGGSGSSAGEGDGVFGPVTVDESFGPTPSPGLLNTDDLQVNTGPVVCLNPDQPGSDDNPIACQFIRIINFLSVGVGIIIAIALIYSGILYITSRGDPNQTKRAVNHAWQAGVALVLFIFGWALLNFLVPGGVLTGADQTPAACLTDPNVTCE